jgi:hypothetical protein
MINKEELTELGYKQPYKNINLYISLIEDGEGYFTIAFPIDDSDFFKDTFITGDYLKFFIKGWCCHTKFKKESTKWVLPTLVSDYFWHRHDTKNQIRWAKIAMSKNSNLSYKQFGNNLKNLL